MITKTVIEITDSDLRAAVAEIAVRFGMDVETFVALGRSGELQDDELRDAWMAFGSALAAG